MISTSIIILFIVGIVVLLAGFFSKKRWLNLIAIFVLVLSSWMLISELLTGAKF